MKALMRLFALLIIVSACVACALADGISAWMGERE